MVLPAGLPATTSQALIEAYRVWHGLAEADAAFPLNFDLKNALAGFVDNDLDIAVFEIGCLVRAQACIRHEQHSHAPIRRSSLALVEVSSA
jgi:hypothetical protein